MSSRILLLVALFFCMAQSADACSCLGISDRMTFARSEAIVVIRIDSTWPAELPRLAGSADPGRFSERVFAQVKRSWLAPDLAGMKLEFENSGSQSVDCGEKPLSVGSLWLIDMAAKEAPGFLFNDCSWARYWTNDPVRISELDELAAEFSRRRQMDEHA